MSGRRLKMVRDTLADLPTPVAPPRTVTIRAFRAGDEAAVEALLAAAYPELAEDPPTLAAIFEDRLAELPARMGLLVPLDAPDQLLGTATAWGDADGLGRLHWVAVAPALQGGGLGRPLVGWALARLRALGHPGAYLMTEDFRLPAIGLYRSLGFRPDARDEAERQAWSELLPLLGGTRT